MTGIATFGEVDSIGTATFVLMDLPAAQAMFQKQGKYDEVLVAGDDSVRAALRSALPGSLAVQTAADHDRFTLDGLNEFVVVHPRVPARVRRRGRVRGLVHDLQHAVHHRRPALA